MEQKGILLVNLGSPDSADLKDVKRYLDEFLMDERVIDLPYWKRFLLVKGIILNTRPKRSAKAYQKIWRQDGSPLIIFSEKFRKKLAVKLSVPVALGMRYGSMSIRKAMQELAENGVNQVFLIPLYPHYAMSSYETVVAKTMEVKNQYFPEFSIDVLPPFYNNKLYISSLTNLVKEQSGMADFDHLLFSFHGIPERHIYKTDPTHSHCKIDDSCCRTGSVAHKTCYRHQCFETAEAVVRSLDLPQEKYSIAFQSRLLKDPWLKPYTDRKITDLARSGVKRLAVLAPSFVTDCLETLEEINIEGKRIFKEAGGEDFIYIPCLNYRDDWVETVDQWVIEWLNESK